MKKYLIILALTGVLYNRAFAQIYEIQSMREMLNEVTSNTWVVFDIDNTLLEPVQTLGSDQWFENHKEDLTLINKAKGIEAPAEQAFKETLELWKSLQRVTRMKPVEWSTPSLIKILQKKGITLFALTARPAEISDVSQEQLRMAGINLLLTAPGISELEIDGSQEKAIFKKGILYAGANSKGEVLSKFIEFTGVNPEKVVFIDDKAKHTKSIEESLTLKGIPNVEFRYGAADEKVRQYDREIAKIQLRAFLNLLSDKEARQLMN